MYTPNILFGVSKDFQNGTNSGRPKVAFYGIALNKRSANKKKQNIVV
jgi:hypothetical protein